MDRMHNQIGSIILLKLTFGLQHVYEYKYLECLVVAHNNCEREITT